MGVGGFATRTGITHTSSCRRCTRASARWSAATARSTPAAQGGGAVGDAQPGRHFAGRRRRAARRHHDQCAPARAQRQVSVRAALRPPAVAAAGRAPALRKRSGAWERQRVSQHTWEQGRKGGLVKAEPRVSTPIHKLSQSLCSFSKAHNLSLKLSLLL